MFRCRENVIRVGRAAREQGAVRAVALRVRFFCKLQTRHSLVSSSLSVQYTTRATHSS